MKNKKFILFFIVSSMDDAKDKFQRQKGSIFKKTNRILMDCLKDLELKC